MARHHQGGEIPAENTTSEQHRVQRMLLARAHSLGEITWKRCMPKLYYPLIVKEGKKLTLFISLQLVMEYCLGSASDLLEGELKTFVPVDPRHPFLDLHH